MKTIDLITLALKQDLCNYQMLSDLFELCRLYKNTDKKLALEFNKEVQSFALLVSQKLALTNTTQALKFYELYKKSLLFASVDDFDSYLLYLEFNREPQKKFYLPRRKILKSIVDDLQDLEDDNLDFLAISLPPRVGKSTLGIFYLTWLMGKYPDMANLLSGHSDKLTKGFYKEAYSILVSQEYLWNDVFPLCKISNTSAEDESIDINKKRRYPTLTCRSISGTLTGAVEVAKLLYVDDIIEDLEEALNPVRLQNKYDAYLNQLKDRKKNNAKELHIGTRWSTTDVIGRLQVQYENNPRYRFTIIPALDDNEKSNFEYPYNLGFDTNYYLDMRNSIDNATWCAKYMGEPYIREGLLFPTDELNYYNGTLPEGNPNRIVSVCDVAWGGGDSLSMPFAYIFDNAIYVHDVIFNKGDKNITKPIVVGKIKQHKPHMARFEANNGGDEYADDIDKRLKKDNIHTNISHRKASNQQSKLSKIIQFAPDIKQLYFIDNKHSNSEYKSFMKELTTFVQTGKNLHDDAPDSLAQLIQFIVKGTSQVQIIARPY